MKTGVVAILIFVAAFIITTAALIYFNTQFKNIFKFDFTPVNLSVQSPAKTDSTVLNQAATSKKDSSKTLDSLKNIANELIPKTDSIKNAQKTENTPQNNNNGANNQSSAPQNSVAVRKSAEDNTVKSDIKTVDIKKMDAVTYEKWKKNTAHH